MTARVRLRVTAIAIAGVAAAAYTLLGLAVSHADPSAFDLCARWMAGEAVPLGWLFTESCLWPVLVTFGVLTLLLAAFSPAWRARALFAVIVTLAAWQTSDVLKNLFRRPRPAYWVFHHEPSFSYSSGHALFATVVYALWGYFIFRSALPAAIRFTIAPLAALWGIAVIWSRLALGAHYPTDLIGGVLLGAAFIACGFALVPHAIERPA